MCVAPGLGFGFGFGFGLIGGGGFFTSPTLFLCAVISLALLLEGLSIGESSTGTVGRSFTGNTDELLASVFSSGSEGFLAALFIVEYTGSTLEDNSWLEEEIEVLSELGVASPDSDDAVSEGKTRLLGLGRGLGLGRPAGVGTVIEPVGGPVGMLGGRAGRCGWDCLDTDSEEINK